MQQRQMNVKKRVTLKAETPHQRNSKVSAVPLKPPQHVTHSARLVIMLMVNILLHVSSKSVILSGTSQRGQITQSLKQKNFQKKISRSSPNFNGLMLFIVSRSRNLSGLVLGIPFSF